MDNSTKKPIYLIIGIAALIIIIIGALVLYNNLSGKEQSEAEKQFTENLANQKENSDNSYTSESDGKDESSNIVPAPDFTVYGMDGAAVDFAQKKGKPIIINFWATWCGPCKSEMPHFEKAYNEYGKEIEFMMINPTDGMNDTEKSVREFINKTGYTFPVYLDKDVDASAKYGINSFPNTFFIDAHGNLLGYYPGMMSEETLYDCIDILLESDNAE